jgi:methylmalonyl-CoA mutase C-terminal domain/subunit
VLVGKPGLDGHDRGAKVVAAALRDAGMEVIYTGLHQTPVQIVEAAVQEDVDVIALSVLSGAHMTLFPEVLRLMRDRGVGDRLLTGGGIIPNEDMATLAKDGVGRLFGPGTNTQDIVAYIREWYAGVHGADALPPLPAPPASPHPMVAAGERPAPAAARDRHHAKPAVRAARKPAAKPAKRSAAARKARKAPPARAGAAAARGTASGAKRAGARGKPAAKRPRAKGRPGARKKSARG